MKATFCYNEFLLKEVADVTAQSFSITKHRFLNTLICPTLGWLSTHSDDTPPTTGDQFRMALGKEIGARARRLFPDGTLVDDPDMDRAVARTQSLLRDPGVPALFEAAFQAGAWAARADIIIRRNNGWHLVEVKSALDDNDRYRNDMAYTAMVLGMSGLSITGVSLFLISRGFKLGMPDTDLFNEIDHTADALPAAESFTPIAEDVERVLSQAEKPDARLLFACRKCRFYDRCIRTEIANPVTDLPRITNTIFNKLVERNIARIEDIPDSFPLSRRQRLARQCVLSGQPYIGEHLGQALDSIAWPAFYLDFEAINTALPLYPGIAPHDTIPTQYSIHVCAQPGVVTAHREYLADPRKDCRRELATRLAADLEGHGSIFMYSNYELRIIKLLAGLYPDLAASLMALKPRLVDLKRILEKNMYHPGFRGRASLKKILPVLVPDMSYDKFAIGDGDAALAVFASMIREDYREAELATMRYNLLRYCEQDTLAMVKIHARLVEMAGRQEKP